MRTSTIRNRPRGWVLHLVLIAAAGAFGNAQAMLTVGPLSDGACQYHDIAAAVQAAGQVAGPELIAVSGVTWNGQTTITDHDSDGLTIEGGFANCSAGVSSGRTTLDGGGLLPGGPLIVHSGNGSLTLLHLILQNAKGSAVEAIVAGPLTLSDVLVYSNHASYGAGLFTSGNDIFRQKVTLIGTSINSNTATVNGGGIYASTTDFSISGGSNIVGNIAQGPGGISDGGGIYTIDSNIQVKDHTTATNAFIGSNYAQRNGGGVYFSTTHAGSYELLLWNDKASQPLIVSENTAQSQGGAFYLSSISSNQQIYSFAGFENVIIQQNTAYEGAAFYSFSSGGTASVETDIQLGQTQVGSFIPACSPGIECNSINDNNSIGGAVVESNAAGSSGSSAFLLYQGRMRGNRGGALIAGNAYMKIEGSLLAKNEISNGGDLIDNLGNDLHIANSTIAYNTLAGSELFTVIIPPASLEILHSLLVQPNDPVAAYSVGAGVAVTVRDIGANNVSGLDTGINVQNLTDPFVDAANGDFHIRTTSSAVNRWAWNNDPNEPPPTIDLDGALRPYSLYPVSTPYDFGAYEAGSVVDKIFANGFD
ncbi:MAG: hypothetical protein ABIW82_00335 [Dokdonella sp.]